MPHPGKELEIVVKYRGSVDDYVDDRDKARRHVENYSAVLVENLKKFGYHFQELKRQGGDQSKIRRYFIVMLDQK